MPDIVTDLITKLSAPDPVIRTQATEHLGLLHDTRVVPLLLQCLHDPSDTVQIAAAEALGAIGDARAVSALIQMFHGTTYSLLDRDGSPVLYFRILASAACALARIGTAPGVDMLFAQLQQDAHKDSFKTEAAVAALGYVHDPRTLPALLTALGAPDRLIRAQAARALGQLGDPQAVEPLIQTLRDPDSLVQMAAAEALGTLSDVRAVQSLQTIFQKGTFFVPTSKEARICLQAKAARGLALIGEPLSLQLLARNLHSKRWGRQVTAAIGLAYRQDPRAFDILVRAMNTPMTNVQIEVIEALGYLASEQAIQILSEIAQDQYIPVHVTHHALQILKRINHR
jgi:HEAT repeat protein